VLRKLLIALAILIVLLVIGDFVAKAYATSQLRDRAESHVRGATSASASISSFPFTLRLLIAGQVQKVHVSVSPVPAGRVTFTSVSVDLDDVHVDRNRLVNDRQVQLTGLGSGTVTAELSDTEISQLARTTVTFHPGRVTVSAAGLDVAATVQVNQGSLSFGGLRLPLQIRIPRAPLFPCDATSAVVKEGAVELSCTVHQVPAELAGVTVKADAR
jgi:hypothetical protein